MVSISQIVRDPVQDDSLSRVRVLSAGNHGIEERYRRRVHAPAGTEQAKTQTASSGQHQDELNHLNCRFERLTSEASGFAGGDSVVVRDSGCIVTSTELETKRPTSDAVSPFRSRKTGLHLLKTVGN